MLEKESLLEVIVGQVNNEKHTSNLYLITELGTLIGLIFNFKDRLVTDVKVTSYIKDMVCFKIRKIIASENLQLCMLIEHDCLCQVKYWTQDEKQEYPNIMNENNATLA